MEKGEVEGSGGGGGKASCSGGCGSLISLLYFRGNHFCFNCVILQCLLVQKKIHLLT